MRIARHSKTGQFAAIKIISKSSLTVSNVSLHRLAEEVERERLAVEREIVVMKLIDHPNIMHLYDVWETSTHLYLILEYIQGGELFDHICKYGPLSISEALKYFHQIIGAVDYFHRFNVAHRDLKPENILLDHDFNIKIADFGMAAWQINTSGATDLMKTSCGSPHYAAPEIIKGEPYIGSSADIWSCGVILYALLTAQLPFDDDSLPDLLDKVTAGKFTIPSFVDPLAHNLIRRMLAVNVRKRITMSEILEHPFFRLHVAETPVRTVPELSHIAHPLKSKTCIDPDIFANLRTLWHGASDDDLIKSLLNEDKNWQKGIYHLLVNYRLKQAVEDEVSEGEMARRRALKAKKIAEKKAKKTTAAILEKHAAGELVTPSCSDNLHPPRAEPPTPRKARGHYLISTVDTEADAELSRSDDLNHLMLDVKISRPALAETTNKFGKLSTSHPAPPKSEARRRETLQPNAAWQPGNVNQPGLSQLSTRAQAGDDDRLDLESDGSTSKRCSRQLVFSLGHNTRHVTDTTNIALAAATRPLRIKRKSQRTSHHYHPEEAYIRDKEDPLRYDNSGNCFVNFSDTLSLRRKLSLNRRHECNELGYHARGQPVGSIGSKRSSQQGYSQPQSDTHSPPGNNSASPPKRTWLDTIFRIKPSYPTKHTLYSSWDIITTRNECRRLLMNMNIQVQVFRESQELFTDRDEGTSFGIILKCKMDEMEDSTGILGIMKPTKFRVEMKNIPKPASAPMPSRESETESDEDEKEEERVAVMLIHEKGSGESFREIVRRLKKGWTLEDGGEVGVL